MLPVSAPPFPAPAAVLPAGGGGAAERVLAALDPEQRAAVVAVTGPVCILAGAGTGKTRAITHRIAYAVHSGAAAPNQVLAVTFTARAAGELRERLRGLGVPAVQARTFHAAALRQLSYFWPRVVGGGMPGLVENKIGLVAQAAARLGPPPSRTELRDLTGEIEWAKSCLVGPADYPAAAAAAHRQPPRDPAIITALYENYEAAKRRTEQVDFEDLLLLTAAMIEDHPEVAEELRSQYRHFTVDEYQDVNPLQQRLLDAWLGDRDDLCVVGDANQTIYSFTGATPHYLLQFGRRFPEATLVRLVRDYRSTPQVVKLANTVIGAARSVPAGARLRLEAQRPDGPEPITLEFDNEADEAAGVAARIKALVEAGREPAEIAVLYRVNAQSQAYEQALALAGVPYLVKGGARFFDRPEVRDALRLLRAATRSPDEVAEPDREGAAGELPATVARVLAALGWSAGAAPEGTGAVRERWENLAAVHRLAVQSGAPTLAAFVASLEERAANQHAPTVQGVTLASLHAAKGLEWDAVFLVGVAEGTLPIALAATDAQVEEERRLFYVGITRAREHLMVSWATSRTEGRRGNRKPSRFLDGVIAPRPSTPARRTALRGVAHCRTCSRPLTSSVERKLGRCEGCPASYDEALFDALRAWRLGRAQEQGQPAFVVFTDATLQAICEQRPTSLAELARLPGIGQAKLDRYGADVLALCAGTAPDGGSAA